MTGALLFKIVVVLMLIIILGALSSGMFFLVRDKGTTNRTVQSLTVRIALSIVLFVLLLIGFATGLIKPHGITPPVETQKALP